MTLNDNLKTRLKFILFFIILFFIKTYFILPIFYKYNLNDPLPKLKFNKHNFTKLSLPHLFKSPYCGY
jgi:hypothetical protein